MGLKTYQWYASARINRIDDLDWLSSQLPGWIFRGHRDETFELVPSLERTWDGLEPLRVAEDRALLAFEAARSSRARVPPEDLLSRLALQQHEAGGTRLLDFTRSIQVAAFFALRGECPNRRAIWAVNAGAMLGLLSSQLGGAAEGVVMRTAEEGGRVFNRFRSSRMKGYAAIVVGPRGPNPRMAAQQGLFLCSLNMAHPLQDNLMGMFDLDPQALRNVARLGMNRDGTPMRDPSVPTGLYPDPRAPSALRHLQRAPVIKFELEVPQRSLRRHLDRRGVTWDALFNPLPP